MKRLTLLVLVFCSMVFGGVALGAITGTGDNPIVVTGTTAASDDATTKTVYITAIYWFSPDTIGDLLAIQDGNGREIIELECVVADQSLWWVPPDPIYCPNGVYSDDMDSGTLYIYVR